MKCDANTFAQMYETVYKDLYRFALCIMKNQHEAEDAVSEAVIAAYENVRKLRNADAFKSWMFTILSNICKKKLKNATKEALCSWEDTYESFSVEEKDIGLSVDIRRAFFVLEEEEQIVIGLSVFGGYSSKEIGKMLSLNSNTVRSKRRRALQKMECVLR